MQNSYPGKINPTYWLMTCMAFVLCLHAAWSSFADNDDAMPYKEQLRRERLQKEMTKTEDKGHAPSRDVLRIRAEIDVVDLFIGLNERSRPPSDAPCLEHLPSDLLNKQDGLPFDKPDYRELWINLLYRNVIFWTEAQYACGQDAAVQAYISMKWQEHEEKLALEGLRTLMNANEWTSEAGGIVHLLSNFPHRFELPEFEDTLLALVTTALRNLGTEGRMSQSNRVWHSCVAVQALGILDTPESTRILRTAFYEPHVLLERSIDMDSTIVREIRQHALLGYLYRDADEALDFYRDALEYIAAAVGYDNNLVVNMPPPGMRDAQDSQEKTTQEPIVHSGRLYANQHYLTCLFCIDEMWRRKKGEPSKLPEILRFQRDRETLLDSSVFGKCEFPLQPWSLYDIHGVLHEFPFGKPYRDDITERQQWREGHFHIDYFFL